MILDYIHIEKIHQIPIIIFNEQVSCMIVFECFIESNIDGI